MQILNTTRFYDFKIYYKLYLLGKESQQIGTLFYFFAKYGIVFFFLSFIYLIWKKKITAFICVFVSMGIAGLIDLLIFAFWKRPRPFVTYANLISADTTGIRQDAFSFPSSHTYVAFAIATSVFLYGHRRLGTVLFIMALGVAVSRVGAGLHYPSDVIGGALLGIASGIVGYLLVSNREKNWKTE